VALDQVRRRERRPAPRSRLRYFSPGADLAKGTAPEGCGSIGESTRPRSLLRAAPAQVSVRILVTGGAGFIGSHLVARLVAEGARVRVLDDCSSGRPENLPPGIELTVADVADPEAARRAAHGVKAIFHLAAISSIAPSGEDWLRAHQVNATGTVAILDAAGRNGTNAPIPVVSAAVYGENPSQPLTETVQLQPISAYGADKLAGELHARIATTIHSIPTVGLRLFNIYGPGQNQHSRYAGVISKIIEQVRARDQIVIYGNGYQTRDFVHVRDAVNALLIALRYSKKSARRAPSFNVCTGFGISINRLARDIGVVLDRPVTVRHEAARPGDIRHSVGDPGLAAGELEFRARTLLADGLRQLADCGN
jgi:UDP-glucose 4-epimerase